MYMTRGLYRRLAYQNIKKNKNTFIPFSISTIAIIALFYMLYSVHVQADDTLFPGAGTMRTILSLGIGVCGIFSVFVLIYTNGFLMKRRSREFGLYSLLGMEKRHVSKIVFWEIIIIGTICIAGGILIGIILSRLMFMVLLNLLRLQTNFTFGIPKEAVIFTIIVFIGIFIAIILLNMFRIHRLKPVELIRNEHVGEKEPKAKWLLTIAGLVLLGVGYYMALTTKNPITALSSFFVAVLCVIVGTYFVFLSVSISLLKILKKKKKFYYHKKHFITVSGMMYRMKQNAVGLANICILSTCVLVVLSSTVSLYVGMEDVLRTRFPKDVDTSYIFEEIGDDNEYLKHHHYDYSVLKPALEKRAEKYNVKIQDVETYYNFYDVGEISENKFIPGYQGMGETILSVRCLEDVRSKLDDNVNLEKDEIIVYTTIENELTSDIINIAGKDYKIKKKLSKLPVKESFSEVYEQLYVIVADMDCMRDIRDNMNEDISDGEEKNIHFNYRFNLDGEFADKEKFCTNLRDTVDKTGIAHIDIVGDIFTSRQSFFGLYGSILFIGIFIGAMFLITTVMIIYYKQVSEGYDDRQRFEIMKKVGMSDDESKAVIKNQILLVFFLPILLAIVHICFAFEIIRKILVMFNFTNVGLYIICTIMTVFVFFIVYGIVYTLTAKAYYKITKSK